MRNQKGDRQEVAGEAGGNQEEVSFWKAWEGTSKRSESSATESK